MKQSIFTCLLGVALLAFGATAALAQPATQYHKKDGVVHIGTPSGDMVPFMINSAAGQNTCTLEGVATAIDSSRAVYTPEDPDAKCVAVLNLSGKTLKVTTKDCAGSCGIGAGGTMDGTYRLKR